MAILITGATGLVGSEIVRLCRERHIDVNYLTTRKDKLFSEQGYRGFLWNPEAEEIDINCFKGVTAIINLAGASISKRWTKSYKEAVWNSRVKSIRTLHKGIRNVNMDQIEAFVSASAIGIYPSSLSNFYTEENEQVDSSFLGEVVEAWEKALEPLEKYSFSLAKIRIGLVMSDKGGALPEMVRPIRYYAGSAFGSGQQWQSWIHVTDLARIFLYAVEKRLQGVYNGVGPNPVTNTKLTREIAKVLDKPLFLPNVPQFVMRTLLGEMSYLLFASQRVSSKKIEQAGFTFAYQNVCRALEDIYPQKSNPLQKGITTNTPKDSKEYV